MIKGLDINRNITIGITRSILDEDGNSIIPEPGFALIDEMPNVEYRIFDEHLAEVTPAQIEGCDFVISLWPRWTTRSLEGNERLLAVHRFGAGYDVVDVSALTKAAVVLCNVPEAIRHPMATAVICLILALSLKIFLKDRLIREGRWNECSKNLGVGLIGKTLGVIGGGNIGLEVFRLAKPFGMNHIGYDPYITQHSLDDDVKLVDLDTILDKSDFLSINCPLNKETHHLIGKRELDRMKSSAYLINTARGPIVDETALTRALQEGQIQGAGIDVFEEEPISPDNPLCKLENVILTPHALGITDEAHSNMWEMIIEQISQIMSGKMPHNVLNPEVWSMPAFQAKLR